MMERLEAKLVVTDTGPLITLAAAERLDYLLYLGLPVLVPDAVFYEAVRDEEAVGARLIVEWIQARSDDVRMLPTAVFSDYLRNVEARGPYREKDLGERAAIEAITDAVVLGASERALLMMEDDRALRRVLLPGAAAVGRMIPLTTRDFLDALEEAQRIQSADEVYRAAEDAGRFASRNTILRQQHDAALDAVRRAVRRRP